MQHTKALHRFWGHSKHVGLPPSRKSTKYDNVQTPKFHRSKLLLPRPEPKKKQRKRIRRTETTPARLLEDIIHTECTGTTPVDPQSRFGYNPSGVHHQDVFPFLSLPLDLVLQVLHHAFYLETLIPLARTCNALRSHCYHIYLRKLGVIDRELSYTSIHLQRNIPRLAVLILASFPSLDLRRREDGDHISLQMDVFHLVEFGEEICAFVSVCSISSVVILFHADDHRVLGEDPVLHSLTSFFAALGLLSSIDIRQIVRDPDEINPRRSVRHRIYGVGQVSPQEVHNQEVHNREVFFNQMVKTMKEVLFLSIHADFFQTATLRNILPSFIKGLSICEVDLEFSDIHTCGDILSLLHCPSMEKFKMVIWNRAPLLLPEVFIDRHHRLDSLQLLSRAGRTNVQSSPSSQVLLLPESLKSAQITANYAGWIMGDISTLLSFDIHPLTRTVRPQHPEYCDAVVLLAVVMKASSHLEFSGDFVLTIYFPANLTRHIEFFSRSGSQQCKCALDQHVSQSPIRNVHALELDIERLDGHTFEYFLRWLKWFPNLRTLKLNCGVNISSSTLRHLNALRSTCCQALEYFFCSDSDECSAWEYRCGGDGGLTGWVQVTF